MTVKDHIAEGEKAVADFLAKIGPRTLTDDEARQLKMLRLQYGLDSGDIGGVIEKLGNRE